MPLICGSLVVAARFARVYTPPDRVFTLVLLLMHAMPSAPSLIVLATVHDNHPDEMAALLFWQSLAAVVTIPTTMTVLLALWQSIVF